MTAAQFKQLEEAFGAACCKDGGDLAAFIEQLSRRDPDVAIELRSLLSFDCSIGNPLEAAYHERREATTTLLNRAETPSPSLPGYIVQRRLGVGGQADVFLARQESTEQDAAVKIFRGFSLADAQRTRIDAETKALARLQLPNVVAILDRGQTACGREYIVTRYVDGQPIDDAAGRLLKNESWHIRTPAGDALKSLPVGSHAFVLKRQGELITLAADAVHPPDQSSAVIATFAAQGSLRFQAIRLTLGGAAIHLERLRLYTHRILAVS